MYFYLFDNYPADGVVPLTRVQRVNTAVLLALENPQLVHWIVRAGKIWSAEEFLRRYNG